MSLNFSSKIKVTVCAIAGSVLSGVAGVGASLTGSHVASVDTSSSVSENSGNQDGGGFPRNYIAPVVVGGAVFLGLIGWCCSCISNMARPRHQARAVASVPLQSVQVVMPAQVQADRDDYFNSLPRAASVA